MADFKDRLQELRKKEGWTQSDLADRLKIARSTVGMYEQGTRKPDFEVLDDIADLFDVNFDYLLGHSDINRGYPNNNHGHVWHDDMDGSVLRVKKAYRLRNDWETAEHDSFDENFQRRIEAYVKKMDGTVFSAVDGKIISAYEGASPDTQAAVRAILHVEEDPDGDR